jgi:hypothetical protein
MILTLLLKDKDIIIKIKLKDVNNRILNFFNKLQKNTSALFHNIRLTHEDRNGYLNFVDRKDTMIVLYNSLFKENNLTLVLSKDIQDQYIFLNWKEDKIRLFNKMRIQIKIPNKPKTITQPTRRSERSISFPQNIIDSLSRYSDDIFDITKILIQPVSLSVSNIRNDTNFIETKLFPRKDKFFKVCSDESRVRINPDPAKNDNPTPPPTKPEPECIIRNITDLHPVKFNSESDTRLKKPIIIKDCSSKY